MKLGFKKWFSILGLLMAIIISLAIGTYFDLSLLEGAETMEPEKEIPQEEPEVMQQITVKSEEIPQEEESNMTRIETSDTASSNKKKSGQEVFTNFMNNGTKESFSVIQNF
jgi:hypothetical protein